MSANGSCKQLDWLAGERGGNVCGMDRRGWTLLWALALIWGASYLFIKLGLEDLEPVFLVWFRLVLGAGVLVVLAAQRNALTPLRGRGRPLAVLAAIQVALPFVLLTYGEERIASGLTGILVAAAPIFTALLVSTGATGEARIRGWELAGILVGIVGVALLFGLDLRGTEVVGGLMVLGTAFGYALGALYLRRHFLGVPPLGVAAGSMSISSIMVLPVAATQLPSAMPEIGALSAVAVLGVFGTGIAFWIFYTLIGTYGAARASVVAYLAPGFAVGYGALFLDEPVSGAAAGGLVLILFGSWLAAGQAKPVASR